MDTGGDRHTREHGQSLVELALTMPVITMLLAGLVHFGLTMHTQQVITNASRVGARRATQIQGGTASVRKAVEDYLTNAGLDKGNAQIQININPNTARATVTVSYQFSSPVEAIFVALAGLVAGQSTQPTDQLQATTVMRL